MIALRAHASRSVHEPGAALFQGRDLSSELLRSRSTRRQFRPGAPLQMVPIVVGVVHELLDLAPQEPQPGIARMTPTRY